VIEGAAVALGDDFARVLIKGAGLRNGLDGLLYLRVGFEKDFETVLHAERGHEDFLFNLALYPI